MKRFFFLIITIIHFNIQTAQKESDSSILNIPKNFKADQKDSNGQDSSTQDLIAPATSPAPNQEPVRPRKYSKDDLYNYNKETLTKEQAEELAARGVPSVILKKAALKKHESDNTKK